VTGHKHDGLNASEKPLEKSKSFFPEWTALCVLGEFGHLYDCKGREGLPCRSTSSGTARQSADINAAFAVLIRFQRTVWQNTPDVT